MRKLGLLLMSKKVRKLSLMLPLGLFLTGCEFSTNSFGRGWNVVMAVFGIAAGLVLLYFIGYAFATAFYKGKVVNAKVLKKLESKVQQGGIMGGGKGLPGYGTNSATPRRERRKTSRLRYNKVVAEIDGVEKTLKCNDIVVFDKLKLGKVNKLKIKFGEIIKIIR